MPTISQSVGKDAKNAIADVRVVQKLLNLHLPPLSQLTIDGKCGPTTIEAIRLFQENVVGFRFPDRRVDPGGRTLQALNGPVTAALGSSSALETSIGGSIVEHPAISMPDLLAAMQMVSSAQAQLMFEVMRQQFAPISFDPQQLERTRRIVQQAFDFFQRAVERIFPRVAELSKADAALFSFSASGGLEEGGVGFGVELIYSPRFGWVTYVQNGFGFVSPGIGVAFECGLVWNIQRASDYRGFSISAGAYLPGLAPSIRGLSGAVAFSPGDFLNILNEGRLRQACSWKLGVGFGQGASIALLLQHYWQL